MLSTNTTRLAALTPLPLPMHPPMCAAEQREPALLPAEVPPSDQPLDLSKRVSHTAACAASEVLQASEASHAADASDGADASHVSDIATVPRKRKASPEPCTVSPRAEGGGAPPFGEAGPSGHNPFKMPAPIRAKRRRVSIESYRLPALDETVVGTSTAATAPYGATTPGSGTPALSTEARQRLTFYAGATLAHRAPVPGFFGNDIALPNEMNDASGAALIYALGHTHPDGAPIVTRVVQVGAGPGIYAALLRKAGFMGQIMLSDGNRLVGVTQLNVFLYPQQVINELDLLVADITALCQRHGVDLDHQMMFEAPHDKRLVDEVRESVRRYLKGKMTAVVKLPDSEKLHWPGNNPATAALFYLGQLMAPPSGSAVPNWLPAKAPANAASQARKANSWHSGARRANFEGGLVVRHGERYSILARPFDRAHHYQSIREIRAVHTVPSQFPPDTSPLSIVTGSSSQVLDCVGSGDLVVLSCNNLPTPAAETALLWDVSCLALPTWMRGARLMLTMRHTMRLQSALDRMGFKTSVEVAPQSAAGSRAANYLVAVNYEASEGCRLRPYC